MAQFPQSESGVDRFCTDDAQLGVDSGYHADFRAAIQYRQCHLGDVYLRSGRRLYDFHCGGVALRTPNRSNDSAAIQTIDFAFSAYHVDRHRNSGICGSSGDALARTNYTNRDVSCSIDGSSHSSFPF